MPNIDPTRHDLMGLALIADRDSDTPTADALRALGLIDPTATVPTRTVVQLVQRIEHARADMWEALDAYESPNDRQAEAAAYFTEEGPDGLPVEDLPKWLARAYPNDPTPDFIAAVYWELTR